jgi:hypothetical protein
VYNGCWADRSILFIFGMVSRAGAYVTVGLGLTSPGMICTAPHSSRTVGSRIRDISSERSDSACASEVFVRNNEAG